MSGAPVKLDKDFGSWEKHTKGVGLKLLQKFGFKGRLGANESGIATAVEATMRPAGVGLGAADGESGGDRDTTRNQKPQSKGQSAAGNAVSDTEKIASMNSWKKKASKERKAAMQKSIDELLSKVDQNEPRRDKKRKRVKHYGEFDEDGEDDDDDDEVGADGEGANGRGGNAAPMTIIDMRSERVKVISNLGDGVGGSSMDTATAGTASSSRPKLGEEFLYNLEKMNQQMSLEISIAREETADPEQGAAKSMQLQHNLREIEEQLRLEKLRMSRIQSVREILVELSTLEKQLLEECKEASHNAAVAAAVAEFKDDFSSDDEEDSTGRSELVARKGSAFGSSVQHELITKLIELCTKAIVHYPQESLQFNVAKAYVHAFHQFMGYHVKNWEDPLRSPLLLNQLACPWYLLLTHIHSKQYRQASVSTITNSILHERGVDDVDLQYLTLRVEGVVEAGLQDVLDSLCSAKIKRCLMSSWDVQRDIGVDESAGFSTDNAAILKHGENRSAKSLPAPIILMNSLHTIVSPACFANLCSTVIFPRLNHVLMHLLDDVSGNSGGDTKYSIHRWLLPWIEVFGSKAVLDHQNSTLSAGDVKDAPAPKNQIVELFPEIRRKLRHIINRKNISRDYLKIISMLAPFRPPVFDYSSYVTMLNNSIVPKLVQMMRNEFYVDPSKQDLAPLKVLLSFCDEVTKAEKIVVERPHLAVLPTLYLVCILEGELFPKWLGTLSAWVAQIVIDESNHFRSAVSQALEAHDRTISIERCREVITTCAGNIKEVTQWYMGWKGMFREDFLNNCPGLLNYFGAALDVLKTAATFKQHLTSCMGTLEGLTANFEKVASMVAEPLIKEQFLPSKHSHVMSLSDHRTISFAQILRENDVTKGKTSWKGIDSFHSIANEVTTSTSSNSGGAKKVIDAKQQANTEVPGRQLRKSLNFNLKFVELVEQTAQQNNLEFAPKFNKLHEGKQVYQLGNSARGGKSAMCYVDKDVLFVYQLTQQAWVPTSIDEIISMVQ